MDPNANTSGGGKDVAVPPEIDRWNWGAFFWNWIWGLGNRVYVALWALVPLVGLIFIFVLGAKGNSWAWRNKRWESISHFKRTQRRWAWSALVVAVGTVLVTVIAIAGETSRRSSTFEDFDLSQTLEDPDGGVQITVPASWEQSETLGEEADADLAAEHPVRELYLLVLLEPKQDFAPDLDLRGYANLVRENMRSTLDEIRAQPNEVLSIDGNRALQWEGQGTVDEVRITFLMTALESEDRFAQIYVWTVPSLMDEYRDLFKKMTRSIRMH